MEMTQEQLDILANTVLTYGIEHQLLKAIEEMSELQKELCKYLETGEDYVVAGISEEMADVFIVLQELVGIFQNGERVEEWKNIKLRRLEGLDRRE